MTSEYNAFAGGMRETDKTDEVLRRMTTMRIEAAVREHVTMNWIEDWQSVINRRMSRQAQRRWSLNAGVSHAAFLPLKLRTEVKLHMADNMARELYGSALRSAGVTVH